MSLPKRHIIITADGSKTLQLEGWNEQYHSVHGALQEAMHVFISTGVKATDKKHLSILEIGFGTGLNAYVTYIEAKEKQRSIDYTGVEAYIVDTKTALAMEYDSLIGDQEDSEVFHRMHEVSWEVKHQLTPFFNLTKREQFFQDITDENAFDIIYFDAFGFRVQPELWSVEIFEKMQKALKLGGMLVTYAAKGQVRRNMQAAHLTVERLPGPPGKREMLRATKPYVTL